MIVLEVLLRLSKIEVVVAMSSVCHVNLDHLVWLTISEVTSMRSGV
jgi:hypothetical protein